MLICLGGPLGSGRRVLARKLAKRLQYHFYDTETKKPKRYERGQDGQHTEYVTVPSSDIARLHLYKRILEDFPKLSKMYPDIVIDNAFHRDVPRTYFLSEAKKYFDRVVFVWIESSEETAQRNLQLMVEKRIIRSMREGARRRDDGKKNFQPFTTEPLKFFHEAADEEALQRLIALIQGSTKTMQK